MRMVWRVRMAVIILVVMAVVFFMSSSSNPAGRGTSASPFGAAALSAAGVLAILALIVMFASLENDIR